MASTITRYVSIGFFLWGFLKGLVYETPVATPEDLVGRVIEAAGCVRDTPGIIEKVRCSMQRRCQACLDASGKNFEHLLPLDLVTLVTDLYDQQKLLTTSSNDVVDTEL
ncbi:uncharacterized protein TNCV_2222541 [Trichonephila clavipes]|nr:uncharacterized protein TNCV_2222541 [Trichonephila clavipes]